MTQSFLRLFLIYQNPNKRQIKSGDKRIFPRQQRHALFFLLMRMRGLFSPRVTRARKKRTLTCFPAEVGVLDNLYKLEMKSTGLIETV